MSENNYEVNDPNLLSVTPPDYDGEADMTPMVAPVPPDDGEHEIFVSLVPEDRFQNGSVYVKASADGKATLWAVVSCRLVDEDGEPGMYLKDKWVGTNVFEGQTTSELAFLMKLVGRPMPRFASFKDMKEFVEGVFATAPEEGFKVTARTRWIKSVPAVDGDGVQMFQNNKKVYVETKGQKKVTAQNVTEWMEIGLSSEEALKKAHLYLDPLEGEERAVRAEVAGFINAA